MKILIIGLDYHSYTRAIAEEYRILGHHVVTRNIRGSTSLLSRANRIARPADYERRLVAFHHQVLAEACEGNFDWVLFIQCHWLSLETMEAFRSKLGGTRLTLYNWDAVTTHDYQPYLHLFDDTYTFDPVDAQELGIGYLPLFCLRDFQDIPLPPDLAPSIYHVGNIVNLNRYVAIQAFAQYCVDHDVAFDAFMKVRPVIYARLRRAIGKPRGVSLRSITPGAFRDMIARSIATFDFANHAQAGHTMRVIENLCARRKIVTNNARIKNDSFYSPDRVFVYDERGYEGVAEFLATPLADPAETFPEYRIQRFVRHLLDGTSHPLPRGDHTSRGFT